ncbi:head GIN domain-containing protein [Persicitalea jodogahamensis]|uniref:Putative auto-transporter adhesin head GIN domain-containing protein n=1 Tax=Persicitalea jodogahamensis TaxID=402147 RepID=A0A8J3G8P8_9BACT|nr:head GIN domain-containing protein [Persicitalea jodogahamensis]GHB67241.1 hypothetical protein GCM10007390_20680 [Persicitalea jodogahamensis]
MKKLLTLCLILLTITSCSSQSKGPERTRTLKVSDFSKLDLGSAFKINVERGNSYRVEVTGKEDDLDDLEYGVSRGKLHIGYKNSSWRKNRENVSVEITMPNLDGVDFSGACNAKVKGFRGGRGMDIDVSGASRVEMDFSADKVMVDLSGASRLTLSGRGENLEGEMSGASTFDGKDFPVKEANIDASGASRASVVASSALQADASGASSIRYSGSVSQVRSSSSGAGSVRREN